MFLTVLLICVGVLLFLGVLWFILSLPNKVRPETRHFASFNYAHRGLHGDGIPENSLAAFRRATEEGYAIELDVQLSKDGVPMVFHDGSLKRMCPGKTGSILTYTREELQTFHLADTSEVIPTFREVLDTVAGKTPLLVEIKNDGDGIHTAAVAAEMLDGYAGEYCIESFNPRIVRWFRENRPHVVRGQLSDHHTLNKKHRKPMYYLLQSMLMNCVARPDFIAYNFKHRRFLPFALLKKTCPTFAWTPRSEEQGAECTGFDSIIFENIRPPKRNGDAE